MAKGKRQQRQRRPRNRGSASRTGPSTGATTSKAELGLQLVDFFDYEYGATGTPSYGNVKHYYFDTNQNLFQNNPTATEGQDSSFCRVRKVEVYVLPRRNLDQTAPSPDFTSNASAMFTCNMYTPSLAGYTRPFAAVGNSLALATNNQVTNILPQIDTFWKKVYTCNMQKTFQSGVIRPYYYGNRQCLFSMRLLDPTDGLDYAGIGNTALQVRVKVVMHIDQPIMPIQRALVNVLSNFDVGKPDVDGDGNPPVPTLRAEYVQMDIKKVLHNFR
jgi:hypothetical protein